MSHEAAEAVQPLDRTLRGRNPIRFSLARLSARFAGRVDDFLGEGNPLESSGLLS